MRKMMEYLKSLIRANSLDSSKSFALVLSVLIGALMGVCVCFCLVWDVCANGRITTDLDSLGVFILCVGGFMAGGGINKALGERNWKTRIDNKNTSEHGDNSKENS